VSVLAISCGGGGGGGDGGSGITGDFTLSGTSAAFVARSFGPVPASQMLALTLSGPAPAFVGAAYPNGTTPPIWLEVNITGSAPNYTVVFSISGTQFGAGTTSTTVLIGTADENGDVLKSVPVTVQLTTTQNLVVSPTYDETVFTFGDPPAEPHALAVGVAAAANTTWSVTSDAAWLPPPGGTFTGPQTLQLAADLSNLPWNGATATVRVVNVADATESATYTFRALVPAPLFTAYPGSVNLGGTSGFSTDVSRIQATLGTGLHTYPLTTQITTSNGIPWLAADLSASTIGQTPTSVELHVNRDLLAPGTYTAQLRLQASVLGQIIETTVPVSAVIESERLLVPANGVALTNFPSRQLLSRAMTVTASRGRTGIGWTAQSDQPWLSVTPSGLVGDDLVVTADPAGLANDTVHLATVTLSSADPNISAGETIRVGLWSGSTDPVDVTVDDGTVIAMAANPVEPWVYATNRTGSIQVYNVYSGALVTTFANVAPDELGALTTSLDGRYVFAVTSNPWRALKLDATTGALVATYPNPPLAGYFGDGRTGLAYARPAGRDVLWTPFGPIFDVTTGQPLAFQTTGIAPSRGDYLVTPPAGQRIVSFDLNSSPQSLYTSAIDYSPLNGGTLVWSEFRSSRLGASEICISPDGSRTYGGGDEDGTIREASTLAALGTVGGPFSIRCGWNGKVYGLIPTSDGTPDLEAYSADGTYLGASRATPVGATIFPRGMVLSGDLFRAITTPVTDGFRLYFSNTPVEP